MLNLLVTCGRNLELETETEIRKILNECGSDEPEIYKTDMRGILFVNTNTDTSKIIDWIKTKVNEEPWSIRYCLRVIPIQAVTDTDIEKIKIGLDDGFESTRLDLPNEFLSLPESSTLYIDDLISRFYAQLDAFS